MSCRAQGRTGVVALCGVALFALDSAIGSAAQSNTFSRLRAVVDNLRVQLAIESVVIPAIVGDNPLLVSVEPIEGDNGTTPTFQMSFDARFLASLHDEELIAIVAHELGHVWIFTHHPYLQTERLANSVAMRVVSRESLERVYVKVWQREGVKGNLAQFLGEAQ
jgi:hypothetical protein